MIRVLHVVEQLSATGGTPRKLLYLVKQSDRSVIRHDFLCLMPGDLDETLQGLGSDVRILNSVAPHRIVGSLLRHVAGHDVDVLSTHFSRSFACGYLVSRLCRIPLLHNEHGPALPSSIEGIARSPLALWIKRQCVRHADAIVCNSTYTAGTIRERYAAPPDRLHVIHNPVESRLPSPSAVRVPQDGRDKKIVLGHIGGMIPVRDQATLIHALRLLRDAGVQAELELIGDGPMRPSLERLTAELGLQDQVFFRGYRTDLADFFTGIDIYVNSAVAEGFGIAVVEAMLAEVPVVLADAGSHRELTAGGSVGLLYEPRSPSDLCRKISEITQCIDRRRSLAHAGREFALRAFAPRRYAASYEQLAGKIISVRGRPARKGRVEVRG